MSRNKSEQSVAQRAPLDSRLSGYSAGAKIAAAASRLRSRTGNWPIYAAAAGSALAMTTSASASIISGVYTGQGGPHGGVSVRPLPGGTSTQALLSNISPVPIHLKAGSGSTFGALSVLAFGPVNFFVTGAASLSAKNFAAGAHISSAAGVLGGSARIVNASFSGLKYGQFFSGVPGYVGFAAGLPGNVEYGWLKLVFTGDSNTGRPQVLEALAWGIETTPNQGIDAGATATATPEPGTMALGILAAGAAGVEALRRRRQAA